MVGYSSNSKGCKLYDVVLKKCVVSRDVRFDESWSAVDEASQDEAEFNMHESESNAEAESDHAENIPDTSDTDQQLSNDEDENPTLPVPSPDEPQDAAESSPNVTLRRGDRVRKPPGEWWKPPHKSYKPQSGLLAVDATDDLIDCALSVQNVPQSYTEAIKPENIDFWTPGIEREHECLRENNTFEFVERTPNMHVLRNRYLFKVKKGKPKARLVACGCSQVRGVEYDKTFAPVISLIALRVLLALITSLDLFCHQMDVVTAFLNGDLDVEIFMEVPAGMRDPNRPNLVCKLLKALYGLKQAPRQWYAKIHKFLVDELGFKSCSYEPCLYIKHEGNSIMFIALYVDDLLIAGNDLAAILSVKDEFKKRFKMKDLGEASEFLGMQIKRDRDGGTLTLSQPDYIDTILERFNMTDAKTANIPMSPSLTLNSEPTSEDPPCNAPYRMAVGSLIWLMIGTRPDIAFAVGKLSKFCENPRQSHWNAVKHLLRYVKYTRTVGIHYQKSSPLHPLGYCDSDWASCTETRKSTEGMVFLLSGGAVSWRSKKQSVIATSSCEAEYMSAFSAAKEAVWLKRMFAEMMGKDKVDPIRLLVDNNSAVSTAKSESINQRNKHVDIKYHFVRDAVATMQVMLEHVSKEHQAADPLTKPLMRVLHERFMAMMGLKQCS